MAKLRVHADNKIWRVKVRESRGRYSGADSPVVRSYLFTRRNDAVERAKNAVEVFDFSVGTVTWGRDEEFFTELGAQILLNRMTGVDEVGSTS